MQQVGEEEMISADGVPRHVCIVKKYELDTLHVSLTEANITHGSGIANL